MERRRRFSAEFKRDAAQQVLTSGEPISHVARALGVGEVNLGRWVRAERERMEALEQGQKPREELARENARLRREVERLRMENEFLEKASAFFAAKHPRMNGLN